MNNEVKQTIEEEKNTLLDMPETIYIDMETTGLSFANDELLEIAIIDSNSNILMNTLVRPIKNKIWEEAEEVHGISPDTIFSNSSIPTLEELSEKIISLVADKNIVIYNAYFQAHFLKPLLYGCRKIECCMLKFAVYNDEWSDYFFDWKWIRLSASSKAVSHKWTGDYHRSLHDVLASKSVYDFLRNYPQISNEEFLFYER